MELSTLSFSARTGWSSPMPDLDSSQTLVLVFGASSFADHPEALTALRTAFPQAHHAGCSSSGEICGTRVLDESLAVAVLRFARTRVRTAETAIGEEVSSREAGESLGRAVRGEGLRAVFVLSDGLAVNGSELLGGLHAVLPVSYTPLTSPPNTAVYISGVAVSCTNTTTRHPQQSHLSS